MVGIATYVGVLLVAAPAQTPAGEALQGFRPLQLRVAAAADPGRPRRATRRAAPAPIAIPEHLEGWPIGWGLGTRRHWLDYARGRRIWRTGVGLLATGVTGLALSLSLGIPAVLMSSLIGQRLSAGLLTGFGLASVILTYVGASLLVKGRRIRDRAVLNILKFSSRSGSVSAELQLGPGSLQLGGRF